MGSEMCIRDREKRVTYTSNQQKQNRVKFQNLVNIKQEEKMENPKKLNILFEGIKQNGTKRKRLPETNKNFHYISLNIRYNDGSSQRLVKGSSSNGFRLSGRC